MAVSGESLHHGLEGAGLESRTFSGHYWQARGNTAVVIGRRRGGSEWHCKALWWPAGGGKGKRRQVTWSVCSSESGGWQYHWWKAVRGWFESGEDSSRLWLGGELREEGDWSSEGPWARPLSTSTGVDKTALRSRPILLPDSRSEAGVANADLVVRGNSQFLVTSEVPTEAQAPTEDRNPLSRNADRWPFNPSLLLAPHIFLRPSRVCHQVALTKVIPFIELKWTSLKTQPTDCSSSSSWEWFS